MATNNGQIKRLVIKWIDPWTGKFLAGASMIYTKERMADNHYSRTARVMKPIAQKWCGVRKPKLMVLYTREAS